MPDDGVVALDNGMYKIWFARLYPVRPSSDRLFQSHFELLLYFVGLSLRACI